MEPPVNAHKSTLAAFLDARDRRAAENKAGPLSFEDMVLMHPGRVFRSTAELTRWMDGVEQLALKRGMLQVKSPWGDRENR